MIVQRKSRYWKPLIALMALTGCSEDAYHAPSVDQVTMFEVTIQDGSTCQFSCSQVDGNDYLVCSKKSEEDLCAVPMEFPSSQPAKAVLSFRALNAKGDLVTNYQSRARVTVRPGQLQSIDGETTEDRIQFTGGLAEAEVAWRFSFGETQIWIEDVGEDPIDECEDGKDNDGDQLIDSQDPDCIRATEGTGKATNAIGISPVFHFKMPKVSDVQFSPICTTESPILGENMTINEGTLIVTGTSQGGLYVSDLDGFEKGYHTLYLYTYSNPGGVKRGDRLCSVSGNVIEFIGNTQLNYPEFEVYDPQLKNCTIAHPEKIGLESIPEAIELHSHHLGNYEAKNLKIQAGEPNYIPATRFACKTQSDCAEQSYCACNLLNEECIETQCKALEAGTEKPAEKECEQTCTFGASCVLGACLTETPEDFYLYCGKNGARLNLTVPTDCAEAHAQFTTEDNSNIDCHRDNFALEHWEHALVKVQNVLFPDLYVDCDFNGNGKIDFSDPEEKSCTTQCSADTKCTTVDDLGGYSQFRASIDCIKDEDGYHCPVDCPEKQENSKALCPKARIAITFGDTIGKTVYNPRVEGVCVDQERITSVSCSTNQPCEDHMACVDSTCIRLGAPCQDGQCADGLTCLNDICVSPNQKTGFSCAQAKCASGSVCLDDASCYAPGTACSTERPKSEWPEWLLKESCNEPDANVAACTNLNLASKYPDMVFDPTDHYPDHNCSSEGFVCFGTEAGQFYTEVRGHLRQVQPGTGIETTWAVEPRFVDDLIKTPPSSEEVTK